MADVIGFKPRNVVAEEQLAARKTEYEQRAASDLLRSIDHLRELAAAGHLKSLYFAGITVIGGDYGVLHGAGGDINNHQHAAVGGLEYMKQLTLNAISRSPDVPIPGVDPT